MELSVATIVAFTTLVLGQISKKFGFVDKKFIPYQTLVIGIISGLICFFCEIETNFIVAIITCTLASASAGGLYDMATVHKNDMNETQTTPVIYDDEDLK